MPSTKNFVVWITGGTSGIGRACAQAFSKQGATVVVSARNASAVQAMVDELDDGRAVALPLDVSQRVAVERAGQSLAAQFGAVDVLVNSAGINVSDRRLATIGSEDWSRVVEINLNGAFYCMQAVLPGMREKGSGTIINISSWAGRYHAALTGAAYNATKHAMAAMTMQVAAEECVNGIRACTIYPGETDTPILSNRPNPPSAETLVMMLQPEDVAAAVEFVVALPPRATVNELVISPTWNRALVGFGAPPERLVRRLTPASSTPAEGSRVAEVQT